MERANLRALLCGTGCAVERGEFVFLCDPNWPGTEQAEVDGQLTRITSEGAGAELGWLGIRTGGSGGTVKFARHDEQTLSAAVRGFCEHFSLRQVNAVDVLPPHHVSGLMSRVRCAATGGRHLAWDWKRLEGGDAPSIGEGEWVLSLVPTQLQRLVQSPAMVAWLRRLKIIFVGGGPIWPELANAAASAKLRVSLSYGMTETAAMVAALRPEEFLGGERSSGAVMPHVRVSIDPADGVAVIEGESVFRGYWPEFRETRRIETEDLARIDARGHLHILGRRDAMIITGGKKVHPSEVEAGLRASGEFADVAVIGVPDREWGEIVVALYPRFETPSPDLARAVASLAPHQRPKRFVALEDWPRNAQGKVNRVALRETVERKLSAPSDQQSAKGDGR
jgi:O-succinylbenzoic acid--CoA ligase